MRKETKFTKWGVYLVIFTMLICALPAFHAYAGDEDTIAAYQPTGYENLSLEKPVEASSDETKYEMGVCDWQKEWLCDNDLFAGWTTAFDEGVTDSNTPAWVTIDLEQVSQVARIVLFPPQEPNDVNFPKAFKLQLSDDNGESGTWNTVYENTDVSATSDAPLVVDLPKLPTGRYLRLYVTKRAETSAGEDCIVQIGEIAVYGSVGVYTSDDFDSYIPAGYATVSTGKEVKASSETDATFLTDGALGNVWKADLTQANPGWAQINLGTLYKLRRVVLFPQSIHTYGEGFPLNYSVEISENGSTWNLAEKKQSASVPSEPVVLDLNDLPIAQFVRITAESNENLSLAEIGVFAEVGEARVEFDRPQLELAVGDTDLLKATLYNDCAVELTHREWSSSDENIVTVDQDGNVKAVSAGKADIRVHNNQRDITGICTVTVKDKKQNVFDENIVVSMFWPPIGGYVTEEQYKLLAEAGINYVMGAGEEVGSKETQLKMLEYCNKYGMQMTVGDDRLGPTLINKSAEEIKQILNEYKNVPGVGGYWLIDEPGNANLFNETYKILKTIEPDKYVYLNFLPGIGEDYRSGIDDWLRLNASTGYPQDYFIYDFYPFRVNNTTAVDTMLYCLTSGWQAGLVNNVKTGTFIQSMGIDNVYRAPNENEIRWQTNISLGFGCKYLSYFTWFQPPRAGELFNASIIDREGNKTPLYDAVKKINKEILTLGKTLVNLDALEVYFNGNTYGVTNSIPNDFFVQPIDNTDYQVSFLRNPDTGRNYLMVVNNSFTDAATLQLDLDDRITKLQLVSREDGTLIDYPVTNGKLVIDAGVGTGYLFALPSNCDFIRPAEEPAEEENLAPYAYLTVTSSQGGEKYYIRNLIDKQRFSTTEAKGWRTDQGNVVIDFDFGKLRNINRVDLYPTGKKANYGEEMPADFTIEVSGDGENWSQVKNVESYVQEDQTAPSYVFDTASARYLRIHITKTNGTYVSLAEIEIYQDNGNVEPPQSINTVWTKSEDNLAPGASITATSSQESSGWALNHLIDGERFYTDQNASNGYCTATDGPVDVVLDFGEKTWFNRTVLYPADQAYTNYMPAEFSFDISDDGNQWTTIYSVKDYEHTTGLEPLEFTFDPVQSRYLRWHIERPIMEEVCVAELEVYYDEPNLIALKEAVASADLLKKEDYTESSYNAFLTNLNNAKAIIKNSHVSQEIINAAVTSLKEAVGALVRVEKLTVEGGKGSGNYEAGKVVNIQADPAPTGQKFKNWTTADGGIFGDATKEETTYTMPGKAATITANYEPAHVPTPEYEITEGNGSTYTLESGTPLVFKANGEFKNCKDVKIDGRLLTRDADYTLASGSTIVMLTNAYLENLSIGKHTIEIIYHDGSAKGEFTINAAPSQDNGSSNQPNPGTTPDGNTGENAGGDTNPNKPGQGNAGTGQTLPPKTGDKNNTIPLLAILLLSLGGIGIVAGKGKKSQRM